MAAPRPTEDDTPSRIARVEHGLIPDVRVTGETGGWSIEDRLRAHHTPGVGIAVIHGYRVLWAKSYGVANAASGAPLTDATMMQAASVSKMFTAMATLKEVEAGELSIDSNVNLTLRSWQLPDNGLTRMAPVTLRELLSHTAGINVRSFLGYAPGEELPSLRQILDGSPPATNLAIGVEIAPGTQFRYSGGGMMVVQQMLVDADGRAFPSIMDTKVLAPLLLSHSTFAELSASDSTHILAAAHDYDGSTIAGQHRIYPQSAAAGLWTTPADMARFVAEIQLGLQGRSSVVSQEVATRMTTPVMSIAGGAAVAMGTVVEKHGDASYFGHDGLSDGFLAMCRASMTKGDGAVVMANGLASAPLLLEIFRSIAAEYAWDGWLTPPIEVVHVNHARLVALAGRYGSGEESIRIAVKGNGLEVQEPFKEAVRLLPMADDAFMGRDGTQFSFVREPTGIEEVVRTRAEWPPAGPPVILPRMRYDAATEPLSLLEEGRLNEALGAYRKLLQKHPHDPAADEGRFEGLGEDLLYRQLDPKRAVVVFQANLALHPDSPMSYVDLSEALYRAGRRREAFLPFMKAQTLFAQDSNMGEFERTYFRWKVQRLRALKIDAN